MVIPSDNLQVKIHAEVIVYRIRPRGSESGALGCYHLSSGNLVESRPVDPADPEHLQVTAVSASPLTVRLKTGSGPETILDSAPAADRRLAVTCSLLTHLARSRRDQTAEAAAPYPDVASSRFRGSRKPAPKRPSGLSLINPTARKPRTERGLRFDSDSQ